MTNASFSASLNHLLGRDARRETQSLPAPGDGGRGPEQQEKPASE
jgi:hypothetical protein